MKKYKMGYQIYISVLALTMISLLLLFMGDIKYMFYIFSLPLLIVIYMCLIDITFFTYKSVDTLGVLNKTFFINTLIKWDEVYEVYNIRGIYPASGYIIKVLFKYIVLIKGKDKKIIISNWTKNSKQLIRTVVDECKKRDIKIDLKIEKIIE